MGLRLSYGPPPPYGPAWYQLAWPLALAAAAVAAEAALDRLQWHAPTPWAECAEVCRADGLRVLHVAPAECRCMVPDRRSPRLRRAHRSRPSLEM